MKYLGLFICFFSLQPTFAQEQLSLLDCVNIAITNSLQIDQANYQYENAALDYNQSKLERLPSLSANTSHSLNFGRSLDFTTYDFNTQTTQSNSFGLSTGATLYSGGRINNTIKLLELSKQKSETNLKKLKDDIALLIAQNYLSALTAKQQILVAKNMVDLRQQDVDRTKKLIDAGVEAGSLQIDMEAQLANAQFQWQQAKNNYDMAMLQLKQNMMVDFNREFTIVEPTIDFPSITYVEEELNPSEVFHYALLTQGSIQMANQDVQIAEMNKKLANAQRYPSISFGAGMNTYHSSLGQEVVGTEVSETRIPIEGISLPNQQPYISFINSFPIQEDSPFFNQVENNLSQNMGVSVSIPIFSKGNALKQVKQAELNIKQAQVSTQMAERDLEQSIQRAYMDAILAYKALQAAELQLISVEKASEFAKKRYDIGTASIYEYFSAQNNLANTKVELTQAKYDYLYKVKILEFYKKNQFEF